MKRNLEWNKLLAAERERQSGSTSNVRKLSTDLRSEFEKDYHRIIGSASFRRLQDKTQVFPLDKSDFIRTRLTHSLEVSSFGKSLGQNISENILKYQKDETFTPKMKEDICNILQCAGLIHDIGNPPFGHFGELAIREWFEQNLDKLEFKGKKITEVLTEQMLEDLYHFEGNAQAFRLVTKLHYLVDERGMNLTYGLLGSILRWKSIKSRMILSGRSWDIIMRIEKCLRLSRKQPEQKAIVTHWHLSWKPQMILRTKQRISKMRLSKVFCLTEHSARN